MVITGLMDKGYKQLAHDIAMNHYQNVFEVYKKTGTFWEYYAPESVEPGFMARPDFIGWTGLPPVSVLIEYILGIRSNVYEKKLYVEVNLLEEHGIREYPFGKEGVVSLLVKARSSKEQEPVAEVQSNVPFELILTWGDKTKTIQVKAGSQTV